MLILLICVARLTTTVRSDELQELQQASSRGGEWKATTCESACQFGGGSWQIVARARSHEPGEHVHVRDRAFAQVVEGALDDAARIVQSAHRSHGCAVNAASRFRNGGKWDASYTTIWPRLASQPGHCQVLKVERLEKTWRRVHGRTRRSMVNPPPMHPARLSWGLNPAVGLLARGLGVLAFPKHLLQWHL